jgi:uncharacterized membrane protein
VKCAYRRLFPPQCAHVPCAAIWQEVIQHILEVNNKLVSSQSEHIVSVLNVSFVSDVLLTKLLPTGELLKLTSAIIYRKPTRPALTFTVPTTPTPTNIFHTSMRVAVAVS